MPDFNPRDFIPVLDSPMNRLLFAINHYVSTGDHIGVGNAVKEGARFRMLIPVVIDSVEDQANLAAFRSRFDELSERYGTQLGYMGEHEKFEAWSFLIREDQMDDLARDLRERPGPAGWGSGKKVIDRYKWEI